jgi:hypothetical protein
VTAAVVHGQTAKVIQLSPEDAAQRKTLEDQRTAIEQKIKDFDDSLRQRYTTVLEGDKDASAYSADTTLFIGALSTPSFTCVVGDLSTDPVDEKRHYDCQKALEAERAKTSPKPHLMYRLGWEQGVIYSDDFKFIVPAPAPAYKPSPYCGGIQLTN